MKRFHSLLATVVLSTVASLFAVNTSAAERAAAALAWPPQAKETRPWAYWWWMGSAVDATNLTHELERYRAAGMGGVHIIPIYGAKGWEASYLPYLSPQWLDMLRHSVSEARRLDLDVDMTLGSGWCFGGPRVTDQEANAAVVAKTFDVPAGAKVNARLDRSALLALMGFASDGRCVDLISRLNSQGQLDWTAPEGTWTVYAVSQKPSGQQVKRASPGGEGHMLNLFYAPAMRHYLEWFDEAFIQYHGLLPRAVYHDSYEYRSDWAPDFFERFAQRRGYRLETELPALFSKNPNERAARVKCDYRETLSDLMVEETMPLWARWARRHGFLTRNEAHGSPGNWLDLYALADIPETEMFYQDRNKLVSKFASSAAHVAGKNLVSAETGTWLKEHFTETLADMKYLLDDLFVSGVNHVIYHGTCYSPDAAPWPGWLFYASYEMNPRNSVWRDVPALNAYAARCQSVLQSGRPDQDLLLYWPLHEFWQNPAGLARNMSVHAREWFEQQPVGKTAEQLWSRGFSFDYVSDRQLAAAAGTRGGIKVAGGTYRTVVVPTCHLIPIPTLTQLLAMAQAGATVVFENELPADVPGWGQLEQRRAELRRLLQRLTLTKAPDSQVRVARLGKGRVLVGAVEPALGLAGVAREPLVDHPGLWFIRRGVEGGRYYFLANRGDQVIDDWLSLACTAKSVALLDPMTGRSGFAPIQKASRNSTQVRVQLQPGESLILRTVENRALKGPSWDYWRGCGEPVVLKGQWQLQFLSGGPTRPPETQIETLVSWTELGNEATPAFAGTARYSLTFDAPATASGPFWLDLGKVCQSARVRLNEGEWSSLLTPPYRAVVKTLRPKANRLEIEVTSTSANRIRDLDRRKVAWHEFRDIGFVNLNYRPFNAAEWPLAEAGLLGPVTLTPIQADRGEGGRR